MMAAVHGQLDHQQCVKLRLWLRRVRIESQKLRTHAAFEMRKRRTDGSIELVPTREETARPCDDITNQTRFHLILTNYNQVLYRSDPSK